MKFDLHIHSKYSYDSITSPKNIIKVAKKKGLNGIAVTDHNTIKGGLKTFKENTNKDFYVIIGAEIKTEYGDIIGLFLNEEINSRNFEDVISEINEQSGISILAHPYRNNICIDEIISKVDLIEIFNARSKKEWNIKAFKLASKYKKPISAGSDSHLYFEIGKGILELANLNSILTEKASYKGKESNYYFIHGLSVTIEKLRKILSI